MPRPVPIVVRAFLVLGLCAFTMGVCAGAQRLAWVVGQEAYPNARLRNVSKDVRAIAAALSKAGWDVRPPLIDASPEALTADFNGFI